MNMKYHRLLVILLVVVLGGCATEANYRKMILTWHGKNINQLINIWGYPDSSIRAPNGNKVYVYNHRNVFNYPGYTTGGYTLVSTTKEGKTVVIQQPVIQLPSQTYYEHCKTWFEYNKAHIIVRVTFRGNACMM